MSKFDEDEARLYTEIAFSGPRWAKMALAFGAPLDAVVARMDQLGVMPERPSIQPRAALKEGASR